MRACVTKETGKEGSREGHVVFVVLTCEARNENCRKLQKGRTMFVGVRTETNTSVRTLDFEQESRIKALAMDPLVVV